MIRISLTFLSSNTGGIVISIALCVFFVPWYKSLSLAKLSVKTPFILLNARVNHKRTKFEKMQKKGNLDRVLPGIHSQKVAKFRQAKYNVLYGKQGALTIAQKDIGKSVRQGIAKQTHKAAAKTGQAIRVTTKKYGEKVINTTVIIHNFITSICENSSPNLGIRLSDRHNEMLKEIKDYNTIAIYKNRKFDVYRKYAALIIRSVFKTLMDAYSKENTPKQLKKMIKTYPILIKDFLQHIDQYSTLDPNNPQIAKKVLRCKNNKIYGNLETSFGGWWRAASGLPEKQPEAVRFRYDCGTLHGRDKCTHGSRVPGKRRSESLGAFGHWPAGRIVPAGAFRYGGLARRAELLWRAGESEPLFYRHRVGQSGAFTVAGGTFRGGVRRGSRSGGCLCRRYG